MVPPRCSLEVLKDRRRGDGRRIGIDKRLFNAARSGALLLALQTSSACKDEVAATVDAGPAAIDSSSAAGPPPPLTYPIDVVIGRLPNAPLAVPVLPGASVAELTRLRPGAHPTSLTDRIWVEAISEGPVRAAVFMLTRDGTQRVESITLSLRPEFGHPTHFDAMKAGIEARLGPSKPLSADGYLGMTWAVPGHRIELRRDQKQADEPQLFFHFKGGREVEIP